MLLRPSLSLRGGWWRRRPTCLLGMTYKTPVPFGAGRLGKSVGFTLSQASFRFQKDGDRWNQAWRVLSEGLRPQLQILFELPLRARGQRFVLLSAPPGAPIASGAILNSNFAELHQIICRFFPGRFFPEIEPLPRVCRSAHEAERQLLLPELEFQAGTEGFL